LPPRPDRARGLPLYQNQDWKGDGQGFDPEQFGPKRQLLNRICASDHCLGGTPTHPLLTLGNQGKKSGSSLLKNFGDEVSVETLVEVVQFPTILALAFLLLPCITIEKEQRVGSIERQSWQGSKRKARARMTGNCTISTRVNADLNKILEKRTPPSFSP